MAGVTLDLFDVHRAKSRKGDTMGAAVVEMFIQECDIMSMIDFTTLGTVETRARRTNSIPTVGFREGRGERFGPVAGIEYDEVTDAVWHLGAEIDIDKIDLRDKQAGDVLGDRTRLAVKGMSWTFLDYFINGDHAVNPHGFEGLKVRLANSPSDLVVYGNSSSAELDIRQSATPSESDMYQFLDRIDETIEALDGGTADMVLTDAPFIAALRSVLRRLGKYTERPVDAPGFYGTSKRRTSAIKPKQPALIYPEDKGIPWYPMGYKADQSTKVIGTETVNSVATIPAYFVKKGRPYVHGIQQYSIEVSEPMKLDDGVTYRVTVDWPVGIHHIHNRAISKLAGVRVN
jgi:hypothetical protein